MKVVLLVLLVFVAYLSALLYDVACQNAQYDMTFKEYTNTIKELEKMQESSKKASDLNREALKRLEVMREEATKSYYKMLAEKQVFERLVTVAIQRNDTKFLFELMYDQIEKWNQK